MKNNNPSIKIIGGASGFIEIEIEETTDKKIFQEEIEGVEVAHEKENDK